MTKKDMYKAVMDAIDKRIKPTTENCESCKYYGSHHEVCNYCYKCSLWTKKEPTSKNDIPHCQHTDEEIAKSFIEDVETVKDQLPITKNDLSSELEKNSKKLDKNFDELDCISRADARKAIIDHQYSNNFCEEHNIDHSINTSMALIALSDLPSVTPIRPKGHWISRWYAGHDLHFHVCSECNEEFSCDMETGISIDNYRYCPNCGSYNGGASNGNE